MISSAKARGLVSRIARGAALLLPVVLPAATLPASGAVNDRFRTERYSQFLECDSENLVIHEDGWVRPGLRARLLADPGARTVWSMAPLPGGEILLSTGDQGQILQGRPGADEGDRSQVLASLFDYEVFALAVGPGGRIFAAGAPVGTVVEVQQDGTTRTLFDLPEAVIFDLLAGDKGVVYAATGERGRLYRVEDGKGEIISESLDLSLRCLAWASDGEIWVGTDGRGLVQKINPGSGEVRTVYDSRQSEVVALVPLEDGGLIFATNPGMQSQQGNSQPGKQEGGGGSGNGGSPAPCLYQLAPDGSARLLWECPEGFIHCLAREEDGSILVGTGDDAALYRVDPDGRESVLWRPEEYQVLSLLLSDGAVYAGTGNPGRWYILDDSGDRHGNLTSEVEDAGDAVRWGRLRWQGLPGEHGVRFQTRSGFTETPDPSWSDWQDVGMEEDQSGIIYSPPARFLQWKGMLRPDQEDLPVLYGVEVFFSGENRRPRIQNLRVSPDQGNYGSADGGRGSITQLLPGGVHIDYSAPPSGMNTVSARDVPSWVRRIRSVVWEASDPDEDALTYTLEIREVGEDGFRVMAREIRDTAWSFEEGMIPDGRYQIRLTVTDAPSNPPGSEFSESRTTAPFQVDTVSPVLEQVRARRMADGGIRVEGVALDESSPVETVEVSLNGGPFLPVKAEDGIFDSYRESFEGTARPEPGQNGEWIVVRVADAAGNQGSYRAWLEAEETGR